MNSVRHSHYCKSDNDALIRMHVLQRPVFGDQFGGMDHWAIDVLTVYPLENLLMPADSLELQWLLSKIV